MNQYPAKPFMDQMAQHGRYGDSMLVHMNPVEVAGIAALSPTGQLTTNPVTGQPEAFLPFLAPALGLLGGQLGLGVLGTSILTGAGTAAVTGDLKRGLVAGLTAGAAGGIGDLLGGAADAGTQAATQAAKEGVADLATDTLTSEAIAAGGTDFLGQAAKTGKMLADAGVTPPPTDYLAAAQDAGAQAAEAMAYSPSATEQLVARGVTPFGGETFQSMQLGAENLSDKLGGFGSTMATAYGAGTLAQMDYMDEMEAMGRAAEEESRAKKQRAYDALQGAYAAAQPSLASGLSPYRQYMSYNTPMPFVPGMQEGGSTSYDQFLASIEPTEREQQALDRAAGNQALTAEDQSYLEDFYNRRNYELQQQQAMIAQNTPPSSVGEYFGTAAPATGRDVDVAVANARNAVNVSGGNPFGMAGMRGGMGMGGNPGYGGIDPVAVQAGLRGREVVAPPRDYMTGFEPEFSYFQDDAANPMIPSREYRPIKQGFGAPVFDPILEPTEYQQNVSNYFATLNAPGTGSVIDAGPQVERTDRYTPPPPKELGDGQPVIPPGKNVTSTPDFTNADWLNWMGGQGALTDEELDWFGRWFQESGNAGGKNWITGSAGNFDWAGSDLNDENKARVEKAINYMKPFWEKEEPEEKKAAGGVLGMQEGRSVPLKSSLGSMEVPGGGIAEVDSEFSATPSEHEVGALAAALMGQIENADVIIQGFLNQYGPEVFEMVREFVLQTLMPDAQTSGMIEGVGGGMDDMVPGTIGSQQPVAVSPGEYIIPADVVSDLGDGSSDAGAAELDAMLGRVRMARGGTADQPPAIDAPSVMPA